MDNVILMFIFLLGGIFLVWFSHNKKYYKKTAEVQGVGTAEKKFKIMKICGYFLLFGTVVFGFFVFIN